MSVKIVSRWDSNKVLYESQKETLREAVIEGIAARANLARAYLARANLARADLAGADLAGANLAGANLADANLARAYLARANLADAYLARANLAGANLAGANLADANLADAYLADAKNVPTIPANAEATATPPEPWRPTTPAERMARFRERHPEVPVVERLDSQILAAVTTGGGELEMDSWHTCDTTHCRAGWAITLAGPKGKALEEQVGSHHAGAMIYRASTGRVPHFFASNEAALADIKRCAELEERA